MPTFLDAFNRLDALLNNGNGLSQDDNLQGNLSWDESYIMSGYLAMYRATGDANFLRRCVVHIDNVQQQRDDRSRHFQDYRHVQGATWAATKYSTERWPNREKKGYAWIVLDGMITYPMADFARIIVSDPALHNETTTSGESFLHAAHRIASEVAQTIEAHDDQWDDDHHVYRVRSDAPVRHPGVLLPHNQYAAMGRTLLAMHGATGDAQYQYKAIWLASYFHKNLECREDGSYVWRYAPPGSLIGDIFHGSPIGDLLNFSHIEDISHGAIEVDFAVLCEGLGIIFDATDLARFASTFVNHVYRGPRRFANYVDGSHGENDREFATGRWLALVPTQPDMFEIVADAYLDKALFSNDSHTSGEILLGLANLQRFERVLDPIALNRQPGSASEWAGVATGDFDKDGKEEIVAVRNFDGNFYMYRLGDGGVFEHVAKSTAPGSGSQWAGVAAGRFDDTGQDKFVAVRNFDGNFYMYKLSDSHTIEQVAKLTAPGSGSQWAGIAAGDFNHDGRDEFVAVRNFDGNFYMYKLSDSGTIEQVAKLTAPGSGSQWAGVAAGDFDNDGTDEFVAVRNFDGNFYMYKLSDSGSIEPVASLTAPGSGSEWMGITAGDFDGDGTIEFAANRNFDGDLYFYRLSGGVIRPVAREYFPKNLRNGILGAGHLHGRFQPYASLIMARNCDGDIFAYQMSQRDDHPIVHPEPGPAKQ